MHYDIALIQGKDDHLQYYDYEDDDNDDVGSDNNNDDDNDTER